MEKNLPPLQENQGHQEDQGSQYCLTNTMIICGVDYTINTRYNGQTPSQHFAADIFSDSFQIYG